MNSNITKIYNESVGRTDPFTIYDGVVGRSYNFTNSGNGAMDIDSIPEHSPGPKQQVGPFIYIERDPGYDTYDDSYKWKSWFPEKEGWAILLKEGYPYDERGLSSERFARWLPVPLQRYMKMLVKTSLFIELWSMNTDYTNSIEEVLGGTHGVLDGFNITSLELTWPLLRANQMEQDVLIFLLGQYIESIFHHPKYIEPLKLASKIETHLYSMIRAGLPDKFSEMKVPEINNILNYFKGFAEVFEDRLVSKFPTKTPISQEEIVKGHLKDPQSTIQKPWEHI
jgi:hypothetical protein